VKVLLIGGHGLLGTAFRDGAPEAARVNAPTRADLDLTDDAALSRTIQESAPDWIVNCAAYTAVDSAEANAAEADRVNGAAVGVLGRLAVATGARVLLPSTDYVFDGTSTRPYREDDAARPLSVYARSKRAGELALQASGAQALIVRSGWLFGRGGKNFPATMFGRARARTSSAVVNDQTGAPTSAADLAAWCWSLMAKDAVGTLHATNAGAATWFDVAREVYGAAGWPDGVHPTTTAEYGAGAPRPAYSVLDCARLDALALGVRRPWQDALAAYLRTLANERAA
jgi:dTDP-4-dehydrorhamnose reductase